MFFFFTLPQVQISHQWRQPIQPKPNQLLRRHAVEARLYPKILRKQSNALIILTTSESSNLGIERDHHCHHSGAAKIAQKADQQRNQNRYRDGPLRVLHLFTGGGDGVETYEGVKASSSSFDHPANSEWKKSAVSGSTVGISSQAPIIRIG